MHLNESPLALTEHVLEAEVGGITVGAAIVDGVLLLGAAGLAYYGLRKAYEGVVGKKG